MHITYKIIRLLLNSTSSIAPNWNGRTAFQVLCRVPRRELKSPVIEFLGQSDTEILEIGLHKSLLHRWGIGPKKILLLHGWLSSSYQWKNIIESINLSEYIVYALDAPGHGLAPGKHLNIALYSNFLKMAIGKIGEVNTLLGHSLGSLVICYHYLKFKNIDSNNFIIMGSPAGMNAIIAHFENKLHLNPKVISNLSLKLKEFLDYDIEDINLKSFFEKVHQRTLVIHDENDLVTPIGPIREGVRNRNHIRSIFTNTQDHMLKGSQTVDAIINFVNEN